MIYNLNKAKLFSKKVFENINRLEFIIIGKICKAYTNDEII